MYTLYNISLFKNTIKKQRNITSKTYNSILIKNGKSNYHSLLVSIF